MANLARVRVPWVGSAVVGPAVSTFYFAEAGSGWTSSLFTFFDGLKNRHPTGVTWQIPNQGDLIDIATGELSGTWTDGSAVNLTATGGSTYAQGVGYRVVWNTGGVRGGRRVKGTTFLAPMDNAMLDSAGTLGTTQIGAIQTLANVLCTSGTHDLMIYSRPHAGASDGQASTVLSATVPDAISWLRSRRT